LRSTLFLIPAEFLGLPVFGFGWLLIVWVVLAIAVSVWLLRRPGGRQEIFGYLPLFVIVGAVIAFLLPNIVEYTPDHKPIGLPVRGYGVMLMIAIVVAVGLAAYRAWQVGIDPEIIYSLAFTTIVAGVLGARLFFIVEYRDQFLLYNNGHFDLVASLQAMANFVKGGLVVYGGLIVGVSAGIWFCLRHKLPMLAMGDIAAASMVLGMAIGRLGCFLNGCCYGGICLTHDYAVAFPAGSPPYLQQEEQGWHSGLWLGEQDGRVIAEYVSPDAGAAAAGLMRADRIVSINGAAVTSLDEAREKLAAGRSFYEVTTADGRVLRWSAGKGPPRSVPVHPTQVYSAIDAALLALVLWFYFPYRRHDGEVFALMITLHPISRFFLEMIRSDEPGQFGTVLTISQWLSIAILIVAVGFWILVERRPRGSALPLAA
jgi:phosphatidylglycerol:prolipoprotein diacylglycerol transferase